MFPLKSFSVWRFLPLVFWSIAFALSTYESRAQNPEFRGIWVDAWGSGFFNSNQVAKLVNDCHTYNFNAVIVQMRRRGDAFYFPTAPNLEPRTTALSANYDALAEVINQCHNANPRIEVHCWVTTFAIWGDANNNPSQPGHVVNAHPEYLMQTSTGAKYISEGYYLDPGNPDATLWNYNMAKDVVSHYDVDGFHWDYIRYPTTDSGYNPTAIARYNAEYGLSGQPSPSSTQFSNWRRRQVTDFLRWVNADLLEVKTNLMVSCSVFGSQTDAYSARFQDWTNWNNLGIIDVCMPMGYTSDFNLFKSRCDTAAANQGIRRVYYGQGSYLNTPAGSVQQLDYATKTKGLLGTVFYSYRTPNSGTVDQTGTFTYVRDNHQPTWVNTPTLPWKATPTNGLLKGKVFRTDNSNGLYNATVNITNNTTGTYTRSQLTEPHGTFGFFDARPGNYTVSVQTIGLGNYTTNVTLVAGRILHLNIPILAVDSTPPTISNIVVSNVTDEQATITWTTEEDSDSVVEYGETTTYNLTELNIALTKSHSITLTNLKDDTIYNFRVSSADVSGNRRSSTNKTFRTNPFGIVNDLIVDNPEATITGAWTTGTSSGDKFGANYVFKSASSFGSVQFTPNIVVPGDYDVFEWHPQGSNRAEDAPHTITSADGDDFVEVNQKVDGGKWNYLGTYAFDAGTEGYVTIDNGFSIGSVVLADAIKFVYVYQEPNAPSNLSATAAGDSQINLSWQDNSTNELSFIISRSTNSAGPFEDVATRRADIATYSDINLAEGTTYYYRVRSWTPGGDSDPSNTADATTASGPPVIVTQPVSQTAGEGETVNFFVTARAHTLSYQWVFNDVIIPGATTSQLTVTNISLAHEGEYKVYVANTVTNVVSDIAKLQLNYALHITSTPGGTAEASPNQTSYGFNDSVIVTAVPDADGTFVGWSGDVVSTNLSLSLTMTRSYHLTANFMPKVDIIVDDPEASLDGNWTISSATTEKYGTSYGFIGSTVSGASAQALYVPNIVRPGSYDVFAWYSSGASRSAQVPIFIAYNGGSVGVSLNQTTNGGQWRLLTSAKSFVAGSSGSIRMLNNTGESNKLVVADAFRFSLVNPAAIIVQPQSVSVKKDNPASFSVLASGTALTYQWRLKGANISGATRATYAIPSAQLSHLGDYDVLIGNQIGAITSAPATLSMVVTIPQLGSPAQMPDKRFQFRQTGDTGNYVIEASTNLSSWVPLTNLSTTNGIIQFIDNASTNMPKRFYRSKMAP